MLTLLRERGAAAPRGSAALDLLLLLASFALVHKLYLGDLDFISARVKVMFAALLFMMVSLNAGGVYRADHPRALYDELARVVLCWALSLAAIGLFAFLSKTGESVSRVWVGGSMLLTLTGWISSRIVYAFVTRHSNASHDRHRSVVVVGQGDDAARVLERLSIDDGSIYRLAGLFSDCELQEKRAPDGPIDRVVAFVEQCRREHRPIDEVWIVLPVTEAVRIRRIAKSLRDSSVEVCVVPDAFGLQLLSGSVSNVADLAVVNISDIRLPSQAEWFKRVLDYSVAFSALLVLSPLLLLIALAIRLESPGPVIFRQKRYGMGGKEIEIWKFRSMRSGAEPDGTRQATRNDSRVTRVGRLLRRTSLDELPQFVNVLQGSMSIVGPRPHAVVHNEQYRQQIDGYMMRHKIRPGITGWAQVNGWRGETDTLEKMEQRVAFDLDYIRRWSPGLDIQIMLKTLLHGFTGKDVY